MLTSPMATTAAVSQPERYPARPHLSNPHTHGSCCTTTPPHHHICTSLTILGTVRCGCATGLRVVRRFLDSTPDNADGHRILGHLLAATGDTAAAEAAWRTAIKYKPDDAESAQALALSLFGATTYAIT
jgi:hypothetical protein